MSSVLKVAEIEGRGRSLVAIQPLKGGEIILRDSPILVYSAFPIIHKQANSTLYCDTCFRLITNSSPLVSSCCDYHVFCAPKCLSQSTSQWVCQALTKLGSYPWVQIDQPLERQTQARFLIAAYNLGFVSPPKFQQLLSVEGRDSDTDTAIAQFLHSLVSPLCPPFQGLTVELTAALLAKDRLNAFGLMEPSKQGERSVRAYGIYANASLFNHDCLPNACRFDYVDSNVENNTDIIVRMIHDVPEGREICLSYFPVNENYSSRQKRLLEDYKFTCNCDRCKVEVNWSDNDDDENDNEATMDEGEDEDEDEDDQKMDDDVEDHMENGGDNENDFPHAYFFLKYMCNRENCWGTLAPLPPPDSSVMECNLCGNFKRGE